MTGTARVVSLRYAFRQPFRASAEAAFRWCTDFRPSDAALYQDLRTRTIRRLSEDALIMTDQPKRGSGGARISRLVRIFPEERAWSSTHLTGPYRHSQYWYRIEANGPRRSHLEFRGLKLEQPRTSLTDGEVARRARRERAADVETWRSLLAPALDADLHP